MTSHSAFSQLQAFLKDMFQFDDHDLNFGIYKIIRLKRTFIQNFIDGEDEGSLRAAVQGALAQVQHSSGDAARKWLSALAARFGDRGRELWEPLARNPTDQRARQEFEKLLEVLATEQDREEAKQHLDRLAEAEKLSLPDLEARVYNHLLNFFELYYNNGDFGYNTRAAKAFKVPYEADYDGSDTMFHWKHKDSYYIKTENGFRSVRCKINGAWIEFRMQESGTEQSSSRNNVKDSSIKHYQLQDIQPVQEHDGQGNPLMVWQVMFGLAEHSTPKVELYQRIWDTVFGQGIDLTPYLHKKPEKNDKGPGKPVFNDLVDNYDQVQGGQLKGISYLRLKEETYFSELAKREEFKEWGKNVQARYEALNQDSAASGLFHLDRRMNTFYAGNDADFFIHKDLKGFLNQEKERFIQNVIFSDLSGLLQADEDTSILQVARAFNHVADQVIAFLDAIESFQKHLFELKKKVVDTHYLVSVGKIPAEFYSRVLANEQQLAEWRDVYQVEITTPEELQEHPTLVVDTSLYVDIDPTFQADLLSHPAFDHLDEQTDGLLINSENGH